MQITSILDFFPLPIYVVIYAEGSQNKDSVSFWSNEDIFIFFCCKNDDIPNEPICCLFLLILAIRVYF